MVFRCVCVILVLHYITDRLTNWLNDWVNSMKQRARGFLVHISVSWVISYHHFEGCGRDAVHQLVPTRVNGGAAEVARGWKMEWQEHMETFPLPDWVHALASAIGCHVVLVLPAPFKVPGDSNFSSLYMETFRKAGEWTGEDMLEGGFPAWWAPRGIQQGIWEIMWQRTRKLSWKEPWACQPSGGLSYCAVWGGNEWVVCMTCWRLDHPFCSCYWAGAAAEMTLSMEVDFHVLECSWM
jgi:hypothetical protein